MSRPWVDRVWVVEIWIDNVTPNHWASTVGTGLTREDARKEMKRWHTRSTDTRFRVARYERKDGQDV